MFGQDVDSNWSTHEKDNGDRNKRKEGVWESEEINEKEGWGTKWLIRVRMPVEGKRRCMEETVWNLWKETHNDWEEGSNMDEEGADTCWGYRGSTCNLDGGKRLRH